MGLAVWQLPMTKGWLYKAQIIQNSAKRFEVRKYIDANKLDNDVYK